MEDCINNKHLAAELSESLTAIGFHWYLCQSKSDRQSLKFLNIRKSICSHFYCGNINEETCVKIRQRIFHLSLQSGQVLMLEHYAFIKLWKLVCLLVCFLAFFNYLEYFQNTHFIYFLKIYAFLIMFIISILWYFLIHFVFFPL